MLVSMNENREFKIIFTLVIVISIFVTNKRHMPPKHVLTIVYPIYIYYYHATRLLDYDDDNDNDNGMIINYINRKYSTEYSQI
jgi:hypothetical protein